MAYSSIFTAITTSSLATTSRTTGMAYTYGFPAIITSFIITTSLTTQITPMMDVIISGMMANMVTTGMIIKV
jgi:hypothetical protein